MIAGHENHTQGIFEDKVTECVDGLGEKKKIKDDVVQKKVATTVLLDCVSIMDLAPLAQLTLTTLRGWYYHYPHLKDEKIEVQRD